MTTHNHHQLSIRSRLITALIWRRFLTQLGKLPSWIVQVINASTPPRRKPGHNNRNATSKTCDEYLRVMDEELNNRKALMSIVENANRYAYIIIFMDYFKEPSLNCGKF